MFFVLSIIITVLVFLFRKNVNKPRLKGFPEPSTSAILGHILDVKSTTEVLEVATKYFKTYGKTMKARFGPDICPIREGIVTIDYKLTEFFMSNNQILIKSENYTFLKPWLENGLLISDGSYWRRHRKVLTPTFHFEILKDFVEIFERVGDILVKKLEKYNGKDYVDLDPLVTLCTLDIICETAMGTQINAQNGENSEYVKSVQEMCRIIVDRCFSPLKIYNFTFWMTKDYHSQNKALKILHGFTSTVINTKNNVKTSKDNKSRKKMAFLDLLLEKSQMTDNEIREEVDTFMFEGHDTTSSGICFTLYCLANNPDIQEKVLLEQNELFGNDKNPLVGYSELQNMKYLDNVIKETLRLYPPIPILGRYTTEDVHFDGKFIPKNTNVVIFIYGIHRNEEYFPDPEKFDPGRFNHLDGSMPYIYIPFNAGSRNCIGQKFATLEMKSIVSKIVRHFEILPTTPKHELLLSVKAVLKSENGVKVRLKKRE